MSFNYDRLDPGIRDTVRLLREAGFETTDSGDGVSKPPLPGVIPFPHVVVATVPDRLVPDANRCASVLGMNWTVEGTYLPATNTAYLFVRTEVPR